MDELCTILSPSTQLPNPRSRDKGPQRKFSTFIKKMVVELDRDPTVYPDGNIVEVRISTGVRIIILTKLHLSGREVQTILLSTDLRYGGWATCLPKYGC